MGLAQGAANLYPDAMTFDWDAMTIGNGGWCRLRSLTDSTFVVLRFQDIKERLRMTELYVEGTISGALLRDLKPGDIEGYANHPAIAEQIRSRLDFPGVPLRTLAGHFATSWGSQTDPSTGEQRPVNHWVAHAYYSQIDGSGVPTPPEARDMWSNADKRRSLPAVQLQVPAAKPYPDSFWEDVAAAYRNALASNMSPGVALADVTGRPVTTIHRWVREARRRGLLPEATPGRAG